MDYACVRGEDSGKHEDGLDYIGGLLPKELHGLVVKMSMLPPSLGLTCRRIVPSSFVALGKVVRIISLILLVPRQLVGIKPFCS